MSPRPVKVPAMARTLVSLVTPADDRAFVLADLEEEFDSLSTRSGRWTARAWYWRQAVTSIGPGLGRRLRRQQIRQDQFSTSHRPRLLTNLGSDVQFSLRRLMRSPLLVIITVVSIGLGVGATTTVYSVADRLLFTASDVIASADDILAIYTVPQSDPVFGQTSFPDFVTISQDTTSLSTVAAMRPGAVKLGNGDAARPVMVELVTSKFFEVLGVKPTAGRFFDDAEVVPGRAERVAVVSHGFWQRDLGGRFDVIGQTLELDGNPFTIVGVGPEGLKGRLAEMNIAAWVPIGVPGGLYHQTDQELRDRDDREYSVLARAADGVPVDAVDAELTLLAARLLREHGAEWEESPGHPMAFRVVEGNPGLLPPEFRLALGGAAALVLSAAGLILLIACSNVAGLLLAQGHERRQEIAVRAALGAGRGRLVRMLLVESAVLAAVGGGLGLLLTRIAISSMTSSASMALPIGVPLEFDFGVNERVFLFALGISIVACLVFGLLPALAGSRTDLVEALKMGRRNPVGGASVRLRRWLVTAQVAASLVFLVGAGLVLQSTTQLLESDQGFVPDRIALVSKDLSFSNVSAEDAMARFAQVADRVLAAPGITGVALATGAERVFDDLTMAQVVPEGFETGDGPPESVRLNAVSPEYLSLLQMRLRSGRDLASADRKGSERVVLVNEAFASRYWPNQDALGRTIRLDAIDDVDGTRRGLADRVTVVGVVRDPLGGGTNDGDRELGAPAFVSIQPRLWVPLAQHPSTRVIVLAQSRDDVGTAVAVLRTETAASELPMIPAQSLETLVAFPLALPRAAGRAMRWAGAFALVLSFLGIYGIVSFTVSERSREMAIRKAIGARSDQVIGRVMRRGLSLALWGIAIGLAITIPLAVLLRSELASVQPWDPAVLGGGVAIILAAALLASGLPARRLATLDPMTVLRDD